MNPQKAILTGKLKVRGNFLLLQKLQSIFWNKSHNLERTHLYLAGNGNTYSIFSQKFIIFSKSVQKVQKNDVNVKIIPGRWEQFFEFVKIFNPICSHAEQREI